MSTNGKDVVLQTDKTTIRFGGLCAVNELDMDVREDPLLVIFADSLVLDVVDETFFIKN